MSFLTRNCIIGMIMFANGVFTVFFVKIRCFLRHYIHNLSNNLINNNNLLYRFSRPAGWVGGLHLALKQRENGCL